MTQSSQPLQIVHREGLECNPKLQHADWELVRTVQRLVEFAQRGPGGRASNSKHDPEAPKDWPTIRDDFARRE